MLEPRILSRPEGEFINPVSPGYLRERRLPPTPGSKHATSTSPEINCRGHGTLAVKVRSTKDPKVDHSEDFEFGGPWGVGLMMVAFPLLMYYMWIGAIFYDGKLPTPSPEQPNLRFFQHLANLITEHAYPSRKAWAIYWTFFVSQALGYCFLPGVTSYGKALGHDGGKRLKYHCSAVWAFYVTILVGALLHLTGIFPIYTILDDFGPLLSVAILSAYIVSIAAYSSALLRGAQHRMTGVVIYDFFMGAELNPRIGILDFKMFFMVRMPWFILFALSCAAAARQYDEYGYVSPEIAFIVFAHFLYANACAKGEECIVTTWDIYFEKWGFMLIFWNLAGVPLSYCHSTLYLANHLDLASRWSGSSARTLRLLLLFLSYLVVYWIWDTAGSQKHRFRAKQRGELVLRRTFPQLPWQTLETPRVLVTANGDTILIDGWYKYARKIHYTCDAYFAVCWGAITGFHSPFPWFYPVFFLCMILHRTYRDVKKCREKYGESWKEYEKLVPWLFIPYII